jgi:hypothetical protein
MVGSKKRPPSGWRFPPTKDFGAFLLGVADVVFDFGDGRIVDQRALA